MTSFFEKMMPFFQLNQGIFWLDITIDDVLYYATDENCKKHTINSDIFGAVYSMCQKNP